MRGFLLAATAFSLAGVSLAHGQEQASFSVESIKAHVGFGVLAIESNEYVFDGSFKVSHLIWQSLAPTLTAGFDVDLPQSWTLKGDVSVAAGGDSYMEDYDWLELATGNGWDDWTDRSQHDLTDLDHYFAGGIAVGHDFAVQDNITLNLNAGFRYTDLKWTARGGSYVYSYLDFRDESGSWPDDELSISYRQQIPVLFAGIDAEIIEGDWTFDLLAQLGFTIGALATDDHHARVVPLRFYDDLNTGPVVALGAGATYAVSENTSVFVSARYDQLVMARADTTEVIAADDITTGFYPDGAGSSMQSLSLTAGFKAQF